MNTQDIYSGCAQIFAEIQTHLE